MVASNMNVSENSGTPKSSILIEFSIINHPFWGTPIFGNTHMTICFIFTRNLGEMIYFPMTLANIVGEDDGILDFFSTHCGSMGLVYLP